MTSFRKRLTISVASVLAVAGVGAGAYGFSSAEFTAASAPVTNSFAAGTVTFGNNSSVTTIDVSNRAPGDVAQGSFTLNYTGSLNAWVQLNTLVVSSIPGPYTGGNPAVAFPFIVSGESAASGGNFWNDQAINRYPMNTSGVPTEVACPSSFGGQPLTVPVGSYCYLAHVLVASTGVGGDGNPGAPVLNDEGQLENGAWAGGGSTRKIDVYAALGGPATALNAGGGQRGFAAPVDISVPNTESTDRGVFSNQNASVKILLSADAVAARNNTNLTTHDRPNTWS